MIQSYLNDPDRLIGFLAMSAGWLRASCDSFEVTKKRWRCGRVLAPNCEVR